MKQKLIILLIGLISGAAMAGSDMASDRMSDIRNTKHNFAAHDVPELPGGDTRDITAVDENQVCVFCHTPHGSPAGNGNPFLWNRSLSAQEYTELYQSSSLQAIVGRPGQGSKMCLSCHDGTVAIGQVDVINSRSGTEISMTGDFSTSKSNLGTDLKNDHPIGFIYDTALANADGELIDPTSGEGAHIGIRVGAGVASFNQGLVDAGQVAGSENPTSSLTRIAVPLESRSDVTRDNDAAAFISVSTQGSVECTTCHDPHIRSSSNTENIKFLRLHRFQKATASGGSFAINGDINCLACHKKEGWAGSVHANDATATHRYKDDAAKEREFPLGTQVWQASCLNCHDTHTDTGARWLLRQATDGSGNSEIENTCFQCHSMLAESILDNSTPVKDIKTANSFAGGEHAATDFNSNTDLHNIVNSDFQESQANLQDNRHVTCSDCHNPHRIVKNPLADGLGDGGSALHVHADGIAHNNLLSGALSGTSGVEPTFGPDAFNPHSTVSGITYVEKFGAAGGADAVTKEYQVCLKCHSNWGINENTGIGPNTETQRSNTAEDFGSNAVSYHPVISGTDDIVSANKAISSETATANFLAPFNVAVGTQTMYCSDCHTSDVSGTQGPHGSAGLLKSTGANLCADCHDSQQYQFGIAAAQDSGFSCTDGDNTGCVAPNNDGNANNLHVFHASTSVGGENVCTDCHVKISHGWRNKALLADIDEDDSLGNLRARYYPLAKQNIVTFDDSGAWKHDSCGSGSSGCHSGN